MLSYYLCIGIYFFTYTTEILLGVRAHFILFFYINKLLYLTRGHIKKSILYNPTYLVSITTQHYQNRLPLFQKKCNDFVSTHLWNCIHMVKSN